MIEHILTSESGKRHTSGGIISIVNYTTTPYEFFGMKVILDDRIPEDEIYIKFNKEGN